MSFVAMASPAPTVENTSQEGSDPPKDGESNATSGVKPDSEKADPTSSSPTSATGTSTAISNNSDVGAGRPAKDTAASPTGGENAEPTQTGEVCQVHDGCAQVIR